VAGDEYMRLRKNLPKYYGAFVWEPEGGGTAYNTTLVALHKKMQHLVASHYRL
jgi:hypothetical protein